MGGVPASLAADIRHYVGAFLIRKVEKRMQPDGSGGAKTYKGAWQQAHAVLLLQAISHPAAELFGLPPGHVEAEARASHAPRAASSVGPQLRSEKDGSAQTKGATSRQSSYACADPVLWWGYSMISRAFTSHA